jgi:NADPH2:quinone reductase
MTTPSLPSTGLQLRSLVKPEGVLEISLVDEPVPTPGADDVLVRVEAAPINPSDLGLLTGPARSRHRHGAAGTAEHPGGHRPRCPRRRHAGHGGRLGQSMPVGNEGAGTVMAAGDSAAAQALLGKTVAVLGGAMYSQYRCVPVDAVPAAARKAPAAADGASCFVNPLTALGMVETMRREGHTALVHTAAASNLGQMLNRICLKDGIGLVNIVRKPEQVALLRAQGATHVWWTAAHPVSWPS